MTSKDPNRAPKADHVTGFKCEHCEHFHFALMDENDRFIATAVLTVDMIEEMLEIAKQKIESTLQ